MAEDRQARRRALLTWYDREGRDLPWRHRADPYAVWLSEVMLQQTRVERVLVYYPRFLDRFPTIESLAAATEAEVLSCWEGLGYYSRARRLHRAAQLIAREYGGRLPGRADQLAPLPGFGPYTTAAVASIAFGEPLPAVDGNVLRVASRWWCLAPSPSEGAYRREVRRRLGEEIPPDRPGDFNQALMDLGALVCLPRRPRCGRCPVASWCAAHRRGRVGEYPRRRVRAPLVERPVALAWIRSADRLLLCRRRPDQMLAGLWTLPGGFTTALDDVRRELARKVRSETGLEVAVGPLRRSLRHSYTHYRVRLHLYACRLLAEAPPNEGCAWFRPGELEELPLPVTTRRLIDAEGAGAPPAT